ncbi:transmembrane protein 72-like [Sinocyclocheilus anshuiensis]|uniref:transmembrane protein 72-like n=1 Tax=Sinocyclocheilus anshuiensis TaxID=1608454 RepID=UPI0007BAAAEE|nr:PREDICTED: transmembrane protein 72-like [Sinocyclocheilus anshuiensis]
MKGSALWVLVECACRVLGISTAAVLCAVGIETQRQGEFNSLAIYLLLSSVVILIFEVAHFIDTLLAMCLPCPPTWKIFILWKKMAKVGGFQKFLYYTMMSLMCFLHPVLVWHAVIPGIMLVVTGFFNFILSKKKKSDPPIESRASYSDPLSSVCVTDREDAEHTFSFFHIISGKRAYFFPSNSQLHGPTDRAQSVKNAQHMNRQTDTRNVHFIESLRHNDTEIEEYHEVEPDETTSDKAPIIRLCFLFRSVTLSLDLLHPVSIRQYN